MWRGVLSLSRPEFKTNEVVEIYARNSLINQHLAKLEEESKDEKQLELTPGEEEICQEEKEEDLSLFVPIGCGRMLCNQVPNPLAGKAVENKHYMFDELWNRGNKRIPTILMQSSPAV